MPRHRPGLLEATPLTPLTQALRQGLAGALVAWACAPTQAQTAPDATLAPVTVKASRASSGASEQSNSYTTEATDSATGLSLSLRDTPQSVSVIT